MDIELLVFQDFDRDFITYACKWASERISDCQTAEELAILNTTITTKLKEHVQDMDQFMHITHCLDNLSEEEKATASKRYQDHVHHACALTWALFLHEMENPVEETVEEPPAEAFAEEPTSELAEEISPPLCQDE